MSAYIVTLLHTPLAADNTTTWKSHIIKGLLAFTFACAALGVYNNQGLNTMNEGLNTLSHVWMTSSHNLHIFSIEEFSSLTVSAMNPTLEHMLPNGITVYEVPEVADKIAAVANELSEI